MGVNEERTAEETLSFQRVISAAAITCQATVAAVYEMTT
jgi:hypothetical protein